MTADQRPELTIRVPCPTCGGTKVQTCADVGNPFGCSDDIKSDCPACGGTGETRTVVSCAGCHNFQPEYNPGIGWCFKVGKSVLPDWGCASWQAREEQQHGNG